MNEMDVLIEQMVLDIGTQMYQLDDQRLEMFLDWLTTQSFEMKRSIGNKIIMESVALREAAMQERFQSALNGWLKSLPIQSLLWEYKTVTAEIGWWRALDTFSLKIILGS